MKKGRQQSPKKKGSQLSLCPSGSISSYLRLQQHINGQQRQSQMEQEQESYEEVQVGQQEQQPIHKENLNFEMQIQGDAQLVEFETLPTTEGINEITRDTGSSSKRKRGPTTMKQVHTRAIEDRIPIFLNEANQPIGPDDRTLNEFSSFLGTLARNGSLAPLNHINWRKIPTKEALWEYVQKKYLVPPEGKKWVLATIGDNWRLYKCRMKKDHYYKYKTDKLRMLNRPKHIPEDKFKELLKYWNSENAKTIAEINIENRKRQKNMHTMGKRSFARIRKKLQDAKENKEEPTRSEIFIETRRRKVGKSYKESEEDTITKIAQMREVESQHTSEGGDSVDGFSMVMGGVRPGRVMLYGRGVTPSDLKGKSDLGQSSMKVPEDLLNAIKENVEEKVRQEITQQMKTEMEEKLQEQKATLHQEIMLSVLTQLQGLNPSLNVNLEMFKTLDVATRSPGDANSAPNIGNHRRNSHSSGSTHNPQVA